jgi:hypothetical protein
MAAIVDVNYYISTYRAGTTAAISATEFPFYAKQAEREVDRQTFDRLSAAILLDPTAATTTIKDCICEVSEYLYKYEKANKESGIQTSFSNDGQSGNFDVSMLTETNRSKKIKAIVKSYLAGTEYLRAGVDLC